MPNRRVQEDVELEELYVQVPDIECRGLCTDACGPIEAGPRERQRLEAAGVRLPSHKRAVLDMMAKPGLYECPALVDGRCSAYEARPMICRAWGATVELVCPYGCRPTGGQRLMKTAKMLALVGAALAVGTGRRPQPVEWYEEKLRDPVMRRNVLQMFNQPSATTVVAPGLMRRPPTAP